LLYTIVGFQNSLPCPCKISWVIRTTLGHNFIRGTAFVRFSVTSRQKKGVLLPPLCYKLRIILNYGKWKLISNHDS